MPRYFFNIDDGYSDPDDTGTDLPDIDVAQAEAIRMSGEVIRELSAKLWGGPDWRLEVTDEDGKALFVLCFSAEDKCCRQHRQKPSDRAGHDRRA